MAGLVLDKASHNLCHLVAVKFDNGIATLIFANTVVVYAPIRHGKAATIEAATRTGKPTERPWRVPKSPAFAAVGCELLTTTPGAVDEALCDIKAAASRRNVTFRS